MGDQKPPVAPSIVVHALRPQIAVYASTDVDDLARANGLQNLAQLLKPWEASVERVTLRTSAFVSHNVPVLPLLIDDSRDLVHTELDALFLDNLTISVDKRIPEWLQGMESLDVGDGGDHDLWKEGTIEELTPWYAYYREALVNRRPRTEYETFGHPVACIIAVSTSNPEPLNAFAELYDQTSSEKLFANKPWVDPNILRYYVLVHDLSTGPSEEWSGLLEDIRRAYGLHCGFLALNSEAANLPDSAYASKAQRPPPKSDQFADYWKSLPTSPTIPSFRTFASAGDIHDPTLGSSQPQSHQEEDTPPEVEPGKNLGEEDVRRIKAFLREFTVQSLVPWMEKTVSSSNEQLAANRRGIAGRLFSAGRRYFGSRPASPAQGGAAQQPTYDPQRGIYPHQTQEAQTRRLADFAFMICDYRLAASMYEIARKDFMNDKAWRHYASATRMAGLTALLLSISPGAQAIDADLYLEQAAATSPPENTQLDDLRAVSLYYELYRMTNQWRKASAGLARIASGIEELPGALMLEQAAMALLKLNIPARRRFSLLMAIAAHRYQTTGSKALSRRCGIQAMSLYSRTDVQEWQGSRRHMDHLLGRQAYNIGHPEQAIKHFISILSDHSSTTVKNEDEEGTADDQSFLDDFSLAWEALGEKADDIAKDMDLKLPMPLFKVDATYLAVPGESRNVNNQNSDALSLLEQDFLHYGYPYTTSDGQTRKRLPSLLQDHSVTKVAVGAPVEVVILAQNPLNAEIALQDIRVLIKSKASDETIVAKASESARLAPSQSSRIAISFTASKEGTYTVTEVAYRFNGSLQCRESLSKKGPRLHGTRAEMLTPTYGNDTSLTLIVSPPGPSLVVDTSKLNTQLLAGEVAHSTLRFSNTGTHALRNLRVLCSHPHFLRIAPESLGGDSGTEGMIIRNALQRPAPASISTEILSGQDVEIAVTLRGDATGVHTIWLLYVFEDSDNDNKTMSTQVSWTVEVAPFLSVTPLVIHEDSQDSPTMELSISNNDIEETLQITGLYTISASWQCQRQNEHTSPTSIPYGQIIKYGAKAELNPSAMLPGDLWATTLAQLKLLLEGQDELDSEGDKLNIAISNIVEPAEDPMKLFQQILATRSVVRVSELQDQFRMLSTTSIRRIFPLFTPNTVDVVMSWQIPSQGRSGYYHLLDLSFAPSPNIVDRLLDDARDNMSNLKEEGHRERMQLINALSKSELGGERCPLTVRQISSQSILADHGSIATTVIELNNRGNYPTTATLELLGPHSRSLGRFCPPVAWAGRMIHRATLQANEFRSVTARFQAQHGTRDCGSWILAVQQGPHHWTRVGKERLVTTTQETLTT